MSRSRNSGSPATHVMRASDILAVEVDGEPVVLNLRTACLFGFAGSAPTIWRMIETRISMFDLCVQLFETFIGDPAIIVSQTIAFLHDMAEAGLIVLD